MKTLFDTVDRLGDALTFHRDRHTVLAGNLANVDTPGYQPLELERVDPMTGGAVAMARTEAGHLAGGTDGLPAGTRTVTDPAPNPSADGNAVDLEREMAKVAANRVRYGTSSELVSRRLALLRYTATDGS